MESCLYKGGRFLVTATLLFSLCLFIFFYKPIHSLCLLDFPEVAICQPGSVVPSWPVPSVLHFQPHGSAMRRNHLCVRPLFPLSFIKRHFCSTRRAAHPVRFLGRGLRACTVVQRGPRVRAGTSRSSACGTSSA